MRRRRIPDSTATAKAKATAAATSTARREGRERRERRERREGCENRPCSIHPEPERSRSRAEVEPEPKAAQPLPFSRFSRFSRLSRLSVEVAVPSIPPCARRVAFRSSRRLSPPSADAKTATSGRLNSSTPPLPCTTDELVIFFTSYTRNGTLPLAQAPRRALSLLTPVTLSASTHGYPDRSSSRRNQRHSAS